MFKKFLIIGAAGYVAPRHMQAIKETGNEMIAALDPHDSVGIIDRFFPRAAFFTEFERFDRHVEKFRQTGGIIDYVSVCSPNYLHDAHIRFGLRHAADVICEKPLVLNPWNLDALMKSKEESGKQVFNILQLRLHPAVQALKQKVEANAQKDDWEIDLTYITSRGNWYYASWKGVQEKSGGIATNIGIHFFDMLLWIFGNLKESVVHVHNHDRAAGYLELEKAKVRWFLSINPETLPDSIKKEGKTTYRSLRIAGEEFEFSGGFTDLHTRSYEEILNGNGFRIEEARKAIECVYQIRHQKTIGLKGAYHPLAKLGISKHPFELD